MIITCERCHEGVDVTMYFYDQRIIKNQFLPTDTATYQAHTMGKAICPCCGLEINKSFYSEISCADIIKLATKEEIR